MNSFWVIIDDNGLFDQIRSIQTNYAAAVIASENEDSDVTMKDFHERITKIVPVSVARLHFAAWKTWCLTGGGCC